MPLTLRIQTAGEPATPSRIVILRAFPATIGRGARSNVQLDDESVSTMHAVINRAGDGYLVRDVESLNGTVVGGIRVARDESRQLSDGDVLRIGSFWLQAHLEATALAGDLDTRDLALGLVSNVLRHLPKNNALRIVEGPRRGELATLPEGEEIVLGRDDFSPLKLDGAQVSREHLRVTRRGASVSVRDGGSRNGSSLGGTQLVVGHEVRWPPEAHLRMGNVVLALCAPRPSLDVLLGGSADMDSLTPSTLPPPPSAHTPAASAVTVIENAAASLPESEIPPAQESNAEGSPSVVPETKVVTARAVSMSDQVFDPIVERQSSNTSVLVPMLALLVLLACVFGIGWLIMG